MELNPFVIQAVYKLSFGFIELNAPRLWVIYIITYSIYAISQRYIIVNKKVGLASKFLF